MANNIGQAMTRVVLLDHSPFSAQAAQEVSYYFTQDNFQTMESQSKCYAVPNPINGFRLQEKINSHDNFLEDSNGMALEKGAFTQTVSTYDQDTQKEETVTVATPLDTEAQARVDETQSEAVQGPAAAQASAEHDFYTWVVGQNMFLQGPTNPGPPAFNVQPTGNQPSWTYIILPRPGSQGGKSLVLAPYMRKSPPDTSSPVHWGCTTKSGLAKNQPFEILFYTCTRDPAIAKDAAALETRYRFYGEDLKLLDMGLTSSIYCAIEFGRGSMHNYLLVFKNEAEPFFFQMAQDGEGNRSALLLARFSQFNAQKLFDKNQKYFTISIEPVLGSLIIRSNVFEQTPWVVMAPPSDPIFVGDGPISVYGGNIQSAFALRAMQYEHTGNFTVPAMTFTIVGKNSDATQPFCEASLKGDGDVEQNKTSPEGDTSGDTKIFMVDAEKVNGQAVVSILAMDAQEAVVGDGVMREITLETAEVPTPKPSVAPDQVAMTSKQFTATVSLQSSDMSQGNGYIVTDGRSPYIWMIRCGVPDQEGSDPGESTDISKDVMSVDLSWNATSYNELQHTGSIKVLNNGQNGVDYRQYTNRAVYLRVYAWWEGGAGISDRQAPIFEGLCVGYEINKVAEREVITFKLEDYMNALHGCKFNLCPYYDGMKASLAVRDICKMLGLRDENIMADDGQISGANLDDDFGLPFVNPFEEPQFRFKNGTSLKDGIIKIAQLDFKTIYFDTYGRFHYDTMPGGLYTDRSFGIKANFFSSPNSSGGGGMSPADQVWNSTSYSRLINDVYNSVLVRTVSRRTNAWLALGVTYKAGITDPSAEGYLGYSKRFLLEESAIGDVDALGRYVDTLRRRVFIPPLTGSFETYGRSGLKPLDIITLDGQIMRIMNITMRINSAENNFWMNVEGEWQFAANQDQAPALNGT